MKNNIAIIGTNGKLNKACGKLLADKLELNYLDYDDYVEYLVGGSKAEVVKKYGKAKLHDFQVSKLSSIATYFESVFALPSGVCNNSREVAILEPGAYIFYLYRDRVCSKIASNCVATIDVKAITCDPEEIVEIIKEKLGGVQ